MNWFNKNKDTPIYTREIDGKHKNYPTSMRLVTVFPVTSNKETVLCCDSTYSPSNKNKRILRQRRSLEYSHVFPVTSNKGTVLCCDITYAPSNNNKRILRQRKSLDYSHVFPVTSNKGTVLRCDIT